MTATVYQFPKVHKTASDQHGDEKVESGGEALRRKGPAVSTKDRLLVFSFFVVGGASVAFGGTLVGPLIQRLLDRPLFRKIEEMV